MSAAHHQDEFPRGMLMLAGVLVGGALLMTATIRLAHIPPQASPARERAAAHVAIVSSRDLRFLDETDGSVRVIDVATGRVAGGVDRDSKSGFIRGVMRGLMRNRHQRGVGIAPPFRLTLWANGQVSITDTTSGYVTDLSAFGETNRAAFVALLT